MSWRTGSVVVVVGAVVEVVGANVASGAAGLEDGDSAAVVVDAGSAVDPVLPQAATNATKRAKASAPMR